LSFAFAVFRRSHHQIPPQSSLFLPVRAVSWIARGGVGLSPGVFGSGSFVMFKGVSSSLFSRNRKLTLIQFYLASHDTICVL